MTWTFHPKIYGIEPVEYLCYNAVMESKFEQKGTVTLETARLVLRRFTMKDAEASFNNWMSDKNVTRFLTWQPYETIGYARGTIARWIYAYNNENFYQWAIVLKETSACIGSVHAITVDEKAAYMRVGYCLGSKWWGQGIMTEALNAVIRFLFEEVGANRIEARHDPANPASGEVMKKCGMRYEATLRQAAWSNAGIYDTAIYSILLTEYNLGARRSHL